MKSHSADSFFLVAGFVAMPQQTAVNTCICVYVFVLLLIGFQFMSPSWCNAFVYYSWSSSLQSLLLPLLFIFKCILILTNLATRCDFGQSHRTRITHYFHQTKANNLWFNGAREHIWTIRFGKGWPNTALLKILSCLAVHINEKKRREYFQKCVPIISVHGLARFAVNILCRLQEDRWSDFICT